MIDKFGSYDAYRVWLASIGQKGGHISTTGGFAQVTEDGREVGRERARLAGMVGGQVSRRKKAVLLKSEQETE